MVVPWTKGKKKRRSIHFRDQQRLQELQQPSKEVVLIPSSTPPVLMKRSRQNSRRERRNEAPSHCLAKWLCYSAANSLETAPLTHVQCPPLVLRSCHRLKSPWMVKPGTPLPRQPQRNCQGRVSSASPAHQWQWVGGCLPGQQVDRGEPWRRPLHEFTRTTRGPITFRCGQHCILRRLLLGTLPQSPQLRGRRPQALWQQRR